MSCAISFHDIARFFPLIIVRRRGESEIMTVWEFISGVGGMLLGGLGVILAVLFYLKSRRLKALSHCSRTFSLLADSLSALPGFTSEYKGHKLENLTACKSLLWNSGSEIVSSTDLADSDPLRIQMPEKVEILDVRIAYCSTPTNQVAAHVSGQSKNVVHITLDYLAPHEGCIVSLLHAGPPDAEISFLGTLKGFGEPKPFTASRWFSQLADKLPYFVFPLSFWIVFVIDSPWLKWPAAVLLFAVLMVLAFRLEAIAGRRAGKRIDEVMDAPLSHRDFT